MKQTRLRRPVQIFSSYPGLQEVTWYRWEFLRRNPDFRAKCKEFVNTFGPWLDQKGPWGEGGTPGVNWTESDKKYFQTEIRPILAEFSQKWQIFDLFPPDLDWGEALVARESRQRGIIPPSWHRVDKRRVSELKAMGFIGSDTATRMYDNFLLMQFDLNSPMKDLLEHAESTLRHAKRRYKEQMGKQGVRLPTGRRRFEDYDLHLRVWDLKQDGKPNTEIAKLVFPKYSSESALSRVRDHLKAANKLISGRYREIS